MRIAPYIVVALAFALSACGEQVPKDREPASAITQTDELSETTEAQPPALPEVDADLVAAPSAMFTAIEPSELGVMAAPTIIQALEPLLGPEASEGNSRLQLTIRGEEGQHAVADIVSSGLLDDSLSAGHVRIEFQREADGWFPINAYRRTQCRRGGMEGQWTSGLCP